MRSRFVGYMPQVLLIHQRLFSALFLLCFAAACSSGETQTFQVTVAPTQIGAGAPIYSPTPTLTPTLTPTFTPSPTFTVTPSPTLTPTLTSTPTPTFTPSPTLTPTTELLTLTPPNREGVPRAFLHQPADFAPTAGWSCDDFPCEDDIDGFKERIQVPSGYRLDYVGRFPGQPQQITYGPDGRLYATVWEDAANRVGAVYALDSDGAAERYAGDFVSPIGLAFQPGTDVLYVSSRLELESGGALWRVDPNQEPTLIIDNLPCCYGLIDNQPNAMIFGPDGYLYLGVGALTDHAESANQQNEAFAEIEPYEAALLRIQPHTGEVEAYASGLHNPFDITFNSEGQFYATDQGLVTGQGDRILAIEANVHYGWPYYRTRACEECPPKPAGLDMMPDLATFPPYSIPRGLVAYNNTQFPENLYDSLFVVLWNGTENAQRVVLFTPLNIAQASTSERVLEGEPFVTGLIRPIDVTVAPDGSLVVADFIYGHVWRVSYEG